jgi:hypothetical protein
MPTVESHNWPYIFGTLLLVGLSVARSVKIARDGLREKKVAKASSQPPPRES